LTVNGKPIFVIFRPLDVPAVQRVVDLWREMAVKAGLKGLHIVAVHEDPCWDPRRAGFDASTSAPLPERRPWVSKLQPLEWARRRYEMMAGLPTIYRYEEVIDILMPVSVDGFDNYPCVIHAWDNSPRSGKNGLVLHDSSPELFRRVFRRALEVRKQVPLEENIIFLKSWNEWAEGNHLEPDLKFGRGYLEVLNEEVLAISCFAESGQGINAPRALATSSS
jgi:hypothetical protein